MRTDEEDKWIRCQRKAQFSSRKCAKQAIRRAHPGVRTLKPYLCRYCTYYHIGNPGGRVQQ